MTRSPAPTTRLCAPLLAAALAALLAVLALASTATAASARAATTSGARLTVLEREARAAVEGRVVLTLSCPGQAIRCTGSVELVPSVRAAAARTARKAKKPLPATIGSAEVDIVGGLTTTVVVPLLTPWITQLTKAKTLAASVRISARSASGASIGSQGPISIVHVPPPPRGLLLGAAEDAGRSEPQTAFGVARDLGLRALRVVLLWQPGKAVLSQDDVHSIGGAVAAAGGDARVVVVAYSGGTAVPRDAASRAEFCGLLRDLVVRFPAVNDVAVWLEPNKSFFWKPQFGPDGSSQAPVEYVQLLAECWRTLHAARPTVNVIGPSTAPRGNDRPWARSNVSHSPGAFVRGMGAAYRALGIGHRLFDTVGHHSYGDRASERPWARHVGSTTIGLGDWEALMQAYHDAFAGTAQPVPGQEGVSIWYLENGYQTRPVAEKAHAYAGIESDPSALTDMVPATATANAKAAPTGTAAPDQATQLVDSTRLAYCLPHVGGLFNFLLWDEPNLDRWQSGLLWGDRTPKASYAAARAVFAEANQRKVNCRTIAGGPQPREFTPQTLLAVDKLTWPKSLSFNTKNDLWRFRLRSAEAATYALSVVPVVQRGLSVKKAGSAALTKSGSVKAGAWAWLKLKRARLAPGRYRFEVVLNSTSNPARAITIAGPPFSVG